MEHHPHPEGRQDHTAHNEQGGHQDHKAHVDHSGHEQMFRQKFWVSLVLSLPVLLFSPSIQAWLGYRLPAFPGDQWITPVFAVIVFVYGGIPFLRMAVPELHNRQPGMMTLISLAISVAFVYSLAALFLPASTTFFWELATLIDIIPRPSMSLRSSIQILTDLSDRLQACNEALRERSVSTPGPRRLGAS